VGHPRRPLSSAAPPARPAARPPPPPPRGLAAAAGPSRCSWLCPPRPPCAWWPPPPPPRSAGEKRGALTLRPGRPAPPRGQRGGHSRPVPARRRPAPAAARRRGCAGAAEPAPRHRVSPTGRNGARGRGGLRAGAAAALAAPQLAGSPPGLRAARWLCPASPPHAGTHHRPVPRRSSAVPVREGRGLAGSRGRMGGPAAHPGVPQPTRGSRGAHRCMASMPASTASAHAGRWLPSRRARAAAVRKSP